MNTGSIGPSFIFSDAKDKFDCPKCGAKAKTYCTRPNGIKAWPPHKERVVLVQTNDSHIIARRLI